MLGKLRYKLHCVSLLLCADLDYVSESQQEIDEFTKASDSTRKGKDLAAPGTRSNFLQILATS